MFQSKCGSALNCWARKRQTCFSLNLNEAFKQDFLKWEFQCCVSSQKFCFDPEICVRSERGLRKLCDCAIWTCWTFRVNCMQSFPPLKGDDVFLATDSRFLGLQNVLLLYCTCFNDWLSCDKRFHIICPVKCYTHFQLQLQNFLQFILFNDNFVNISAHLRQFFSSEAPIAASSRRRTTVSPWTAGQFLKAGPSSSTTPTTAPTRASCTNRCRSSLCSSTPSTMPVREIWSVCLTFSC